MVQIYNEIKIYIYKEIFPSNDSPLNPRFPPDPAEGVTPLYNPPCGGVYVPSRV
jgi:hypothetical protein